MSTHINLHNGVSGSPEHNARDVRAGAVDHEVLLHRWGAITAAMDDGIRELVHAELAPCSERAFLARYLELATNPLVIG